MKYIRTIVLTLSLVFIVNNIFSQGWTFNPADYSSDMEVIAQVFKGTNEASGGTLGVFVNGVCRGFANSSISPTGHTIFLVRCYSNQINETLTFRYYDPGDGSIYNITETVLFVADSQAGNAIIPLQMHTDGIVTGIQQNDAMAELLMNIYPVPFDQFMNIEYNLVESLQVRLEIYNSFGIALCKLEDQRQSPGIYSIIWNSTNYPEGMYIIKLQAGNKYKIRKVLLVR